MSGLTFVASLMALVFVPQQARRAAAALRPTASLRPDTEPTVAALGEAQRQAAAADTSVVQARRDIAQLIAATAVVAATDTGAGGVMLSADVRARRDSLSEQVITLGRSSTRARQPSHAARRQEGPRGR